MSHEYSTPTERNMVLHILSEMDPDEVCGILRLSTRELLRAFPKHLESYLKRELALPHDSEDFDSYDDEEDQDKY